MVLCGRHGPMRPLRLPCCWWALRHGPADQVAGGRRIDITAAAKRFVSSRIEPQRSAQYRDSKLLLCARRDDTGRT
jgi:hypothetical protein